MKLKTHNYTITATLKYPDCLVDLKSTFVIKGVSVNPEQALRVADILFPDCEVQNVEFDK